MIVYILFNSFWQRKNVFMFDSWEEIIFIYCRLFEVDTCNISAG